MDALVWVDAYEVQCCGEPFTVGLNVTWPMSGQLNIAAFMELTGADTAASVSMAVDRHARRAEDTVDHTGTVTRIERYRCRHAQGHVVPGTVEVRPIFEADGWEPEEDGVDFVGYLVTLTDIQRAVEG
ncbi:DUF6578 domain-containing protein [Nocardioides immobilis]|uniref:DUF6578 domain-containing protein n=1 Tax=Nocardioides immobilis TaxID=2049295 RepID=UPI0015FB3783|nr:DUF6578 domain-containing protein [Nocardioides immobilis]